MPLLQIGANFANVLEHHRNSAELVNSVLRNLETNTAKMIMKEPCPEFKDRTNHFSFQIRWYAIQILQYCVLGQLVYVNSRIGQYLIVQEHNIRLKSVMCHL